MKASILWLFARLSLLVLGVYAFAGFAHENTNFDVIGGLICGPILFLFVLAAVMGNSVREEAMFSLTSPFWPPRKYPQAYWFATGFFIFFSSAVNLVFHMNDSRQTELYGGLTLMGAGALSGALFGGYRFGKQKREPD
jgi:hypothetical protein